MIDVLFVVLPDTLLLDLAGPAEAFRLANQHLRRSGRAEMFRLRHAGPLQEVPSSVGLVLAGLEPLPTSLRSPTWVVLLGRPGGLKAHHPRGHPSERAWFQARDWLARRVAPLLQAEPPTARLLTVCAGALPAADAGLVGRRRITTHHDSLEHLARLAPAATVVGHRLFVEDGPLVSSAGITAGIDLALHLITQTCGAAVAAAVAQVMVVFTRRGPQDPQHSPLLAHRDHLHPAVHRVQDAVCADPAGPWPAERLAEEAHVTPRHLARLFREHAGLSPRQYVEQVRTALARHAIERGMGTPQAVALTGLGSRRRLRRALTRVDSSA